MGMCRACTRHQKSHLQSLSPSPSLLYCDWYRDRDLYLPLHRHLDILNVVVVFLGRLRRNLDRYDTCHDCIALSQVTIDFVEHVVSQCLTLCTCADTCADAIDGGGNTYNVYVHHHRHARNMLRKTKGGLGRSD